MASAGTGLLLLELGEGPPQEALLPCLTCLELGCLSLASRPLAALARGEPLAAASWAASGRRCAGGRAARHLGLCWAQSARRQLRSWCRPRRPEFLPLRYAIQFDDKERPCTYTTHGADSFCWAALAPLLPKVAPLSWVGATQKGLLSEEHLERAGEYCQILSEKIAGLGCQDEAGGAVCCALEASVLQGAESVDVYGPTSWRPLSLDVVAALALDLGDQPVFVYLDVRITPGMSGTEACGAQIAGHDPAAVARMVAMHGSAFAARLAKLGLDTGPVATGVVQMQDWTGAMGEAQQGPRGACSGGAGCFEPAWEWRPVDGIDSVRLAAKLGAWMGERCGCRSWVQSER